jgi:hypothetical protein
VRILSVRAALANLTIFTVDEELRLIPLRDAPTRQDRLLLRLARHMTTFAFHLDDPLVAFRNDVYVSCLRHESLLFWMFVTRSTRYETISCVAS